ncbi:hypothetical protein ACH5RR_027784 [Cinchona calisaya]|uniref:DUF7722 domain-containing protein n=1 Tax=Cinchona calisaya TaxID=153742 RepID=A0ABD2YS71_9GENT
MATLQWILSPLHNIVIGQSKDKITFPDGMENSLVKDCHQENELSTFQMPLHYPRYKKEDYQKMEEWKVDLLLKEYGLNFGGSLEEKRKFAMGAFLWPDQLS